MLLRQTLLYLPAQVVGPVFQFISVVAWTHYLTPESMGVFALVTATQELAYTATLFWFTLYTMRYHDVAGPTEARNRFLDSETAVILASGLASIVLVLGLSATIETHWSWSLMVAGIAYITTRAAVIQLGDRARTEHDTLTYSVLQMVWPVAGLGLGLVLVASFGPSAAAVLWGYTVAQAISLVIAALRLQIGWHPLRVSREIVRQALKYGLPLLAGGVFIWLANNGLRFIVEHFQGAVAVGLVTVGWALGLRAANFASMLVTAAAFPLAVKRAREGDMSDGQRQLELNGVLLLAALLPACVGLWLVSGPFVTLAVAEPFREMTVVVLPMGILAGALRSFRIHFGEQVFLLRERPMVPLYNDVLDAVLSLAGGAWGLSVAGLPGSVAGVAVAAAISLLVTLACGWHWYRFTIPFLDALKVIVATGVMALAVTRLNISPSVISIGVAVLVGGVVYFAAMVLLYPQASRAALSKLRPRRAAETEA
ncbi:MAG: lipopolysaccharide biosynthesis protein [Hyphomicrobiaceae bacterium]|nr:lipopolysaccharide biosynthesis protein [Hyphomicrobiaceae bacterium]